MNYWDNNGTGVTLGNRIGGGGEGEVYNATLVHGVVAHAPSVVKIYSGSISPNIPLKLAAMVHNPPQRLVTNHFLIAWPTGIVHTRPEGMARTVGYLMRKVNTDEFHEIGGWSNPSRRERRLRGRRSQFDYGKLLLMARNLAAAVDAVHKAGYVIGDINSRNVLANGDGRVALIDTDSFQVKDPASGRTHRCPVGTPEYTAPDLQGVKFTDADRTEIHDGFALAVMIYQLLFQGRHPYDGLYQPSRGKRELRTVAEKIRSGGFVHYKPSTYKPTKESSIIWSSLPKDLQFSFWMGLVDRRHHQQAGYWVTKIDSALKQMKQCRSVKSHRYFGAKCTWCEYRNGVGKDPFPQLGLTRNPAA